MRDEKLQLAMQLAVKPRRSGFRGVNAPDQIFCDIQAIAASLSP
jgi:hypothetical protein